MSNLVVDQLKPLLQRLLTMAESHDERLARLEAAHSRLGNQMVRIGEQLTRQSDQLTHLEEMPAPLPVLAPAPVAAPAPAPAPVVRQVSAESANGGRYAENVARLNEQITRVREQLARMVDQLNRIELAQTDLRADRAQHDLVLERLETTLAHQGETQHQLPDRIQRRMEALLGSGPVEVEEEEIPEPRSELGEVQDEVRNLGARISELVSQLGKLSPPADPEPPARPVPAPAPAAKPVAKTGVRPAIGTRLASR